MTRLNRILSVVLVGQIIIAVLVFLPRTLRSETEGDRPLFEGVEASRIVALTITDGEGASIRMAKQGGAWVLPEADDYPLLADKVTPVLDKLAGLKADRVVTETASSHKRLRVAEDDFERLVSYEMEDGAVHEFYLGSSPSYGATHIRAKGDDRVVLTGALTAYDLTVDTTAWADRAYLTIPKEEVVALTVQNVHGVLEFKRDGETWGLVDLAEGEEFDEVKFQTLLSRAVSVSMMAPLGKTEKADYGLADPGAVVTLAAEGEDGDARTYTLSVGAQLSEGQGYVAKSSESAYYVRVADYAAEEFLEASREGFLVQSTPTPEATPSE